MRGFRQLPLNGDQDDSLVSGTPLGRPSVPEVQQIVAKSSAEPSGFGDVNVNSIAPGIAAALVATVAGLAVAIPALFGYNYLASRIKTISADMHVFVDEVTTRIAERYAD